MYGLQVFNYVIIVEKRNQEIQETMLKARDAKYSVPIRYGKVLFCGAAAAGKSNFLNLLMKEEFQQLHISTEVLKPQQVTIAMKAVISSSDDEVEFKMMNIDNEILHLESYLPQHEDIKSIVSTGSSDDKLKLSTDIDELLQLRSYSPLLKENIFIDNLPEHTFDAVSLQKSSLQAHLHYPEVESSKNNSLLTLANVKTDPKKLNIKGPEEVWDILTFMDTGGQPQFISMLPAVNSFAMITFIVHKMETGGQDSLNKIVKVQYGNKKGEIFYTPHPHKYTYLQLIETLISYASNILLPETRFLDKVKIKEIKECEKTRSILLVGTHSGDDQLSEDDITNVDIELTKVVEKSAVNHIKPSLNKYCQFIVPVDNKKQSENYELLAIKEDTKRYTKSAEIRTYIKKFLDNQDIFHVPVKWLLLELEIRKVCQQRNCNLMSYDDVLKLAKERKLGYNGEFGDDVDIDSEQFIKQGLRFHHSFGVLLYFEDVEDMQKLVITNHQWLFNKLSKIVEYSFTCDTLEERKDLKNGIWKKTYLSSDCLDINKDFEDSQIDKNLVDPINAFLKLLEHLCIAAPSNEYATKYFMPCILSSFELHDLKEKQAEYKANKMMPLFIQFKSDDSKTYSFPRGAFCFLVVELMLTKKWQTYGQTYVNFITLMKKDTAHHITLIDNIELFCLEVHVTHPYEQNKMIFSEVHEDINMALHTIAGKLRIYDNLCHGFPCSCKEVHIAYLTEDSDNYCYCKEGSSVELMSLHRCWFKSVPKVHNYTYKIIVIVQYP